MESWAPASADPERGTRLHRLERLDLSVLHGPASRLRPVRRRRSSPWTSRPASASGTSSSATATVEYDVPTAPILIDVTVNGRRIPALIPSRPRASSRAESGHRGAIWPIESAPHPDGVPGNSSAPTQPFPTRPRTTVDQIILNRITDESSSTTRRAEAASDGGPGEFRIDGPTSALPSPTTTRSHNVGCISRLNIYHPPAANPPPGSSPRRTSRSTARPRLSCHRRKGCRENGIAQESRGLEGRTVYANHRFHRRRSTQGVPPPTPAAHR